jgi:D-glycero-D-manno-heptose 1,7-bisphosphate phosphatase
MTASLRPALFLDRDGVLNHVTVRGGKAYSPRRAADFRLYRDAAPVLRRLHREGWLLIVVTNQPDLARGLLPPGELSTMHDQLRSALPVDDIRVCPHDGAEGCACRKPRPGLLLAAAAEWGIDLRSSFLIGDTERDMGAGRAAGVGTLLLRRRYNRGVAADLTLPHLRLLPALLRHLASR